MPTKTASRAHGRILLAAGTLVLALSVVACGTSAAPTASPAAATPAGPIDLDGTSWRLSDYVTPDGSLFTVPAAITPLAEFKDGTMSGNAGCNTFTGPYVIDGDNIQLGPIAGTKMACEEPIATVEAAYLEALNLADKVAILDNGKLQLWDSKSKSTLAFLSANP